MKNTNSPVVEIKPIIQKKGVISVENLPLPIVHYPGSGGTFIAFQSDKKQPLFFCSCAKKAIENYFACKKFYFDSIKSVMTAFQGAGAITDFPEMFLTGLRIKKIKTVDEFLQNIQYAKSICHECNGKLPTFRFCHEYYGSTFRQNYGWYVKKQFYEFGGNSNPSNTENIEAFPQEVLDLTDDPDFDINIIVKNHRELLKIDKREALKYWQEKLKLISTRNGQLMRICENIVRDKFGHKKIGEAWINETMLYYIITSLYPAEESLRHYRPAFLKGLELDVYIPNRKIGIEYQGIQHFEPIEHWGGVDSLKKVQERDNLKKTLCEANQITLIYFLHSEVLSDDLINKKIGMYMKNE